MEKGSFLSLPSEIRLNIYHHLIPTSRDDERTFYAVRLLCRQIKKEYEHEVEQLAISYVKSLESDASSFETRMLRNWGTMYRLYTILKSGGLVKRRTI